MSGRAVRCAVRDEFRVDSIEHQLGASEHLEPATVVHVPPRQVQEALASPSVHRRTAEVEAGVRLLVDGHVDVPSGLFASPADKVARIGPDLDADVDVRQRAAVGGAERPARQLEAFDHDPHRPPLSPDRRRGRRVQRVMPAPSSMSKAPCAIGPVGRYEWMLTPVLVDLCSTSSKLVGVEPSENSR